MGPESKFVINFSLIFSAHLWRIGNYVKKFVLWANKLVTLLISLTTNVQCTQMTKKIISLKRPPRWITSTCIGLQTFEKFLFFQRSPLALDMFAFVIFAFSLLEKLLTLVPKISNSGGRKFDIVISVSFQLHFIYVWRWTVLFQ